MDKKRILIVHDMPPPVHVNKFTPDLWSMFNRSDRHVHRKDLDRHGMPRKRKKGGVQ